MMKLRLDPPLKDLSKRFKVPTYLPSTYRQSARALKPRENTNFLTLNVTKSRLFGLHQRVYSSWEETMFVRSGLNWLVWANPIRKSERGFTVSPVWRLPFLNTTGGYANDSIRFRFRLLLLSPYAIYRWTDFVVVEFLGVRTASLARYSTWSALPDRHVSV